MYYNIIMQSESEETSQKSQEQILEEQIQEYISTLSDREKIVLEIAKEHLQSSFSMERSIGFIKWLNEKHN
jgi:DNA-directed RNA polymerase specialized sigma subunit